MKIKEQRLAILRELVMQHAVGNQEDLLRLLSEQGITVTQATLSRDIKELKIIKSPDSNGNYIYTFPGRRPDTPAPPQDILPGGALSLDFSSGFGVLKTPPGYAGVIALDIDNLKSEAILGTIAGDDTILLIPREGYGKEEILNALSLHNAKNTGEE